MKYKIIINKRLQKLFNTRFEAVIKKELSKHIDIDSAKRAWYALKKSNVKVFDSVLSKSMNRVETLLIDLPRKLEFKRAKKTRIKTDRTRTPNERVFKHIFDPSKQTDVDKIAYYNDIRELLNHLKNASPSDLRDPNTLKQLQSISELLVNELTGKIEPYSVLLEETGLFNEIIRSLYLQDIPANKSRLFANREMYEKLKKDPLVLAWDLKNKIGTGDLKLHAHHIVEEETYKMFEADWKLLGWNSASEMPTIALLEELHTRSLQRSLSKGLQDLRELAVEENIISLTKELKNMLKQKKFKNAEELIKEYRKLYLKYLHKSTIRDSIIQVLDDIEKELSYRKSLAKLSKGGKNKVMK